MWSLCLLCTILVILFLIRKLYLDVYKRHKNVCIVVLGDLGRSPRIQYHAMSFIKEGFTVDIISYPGSLPLEEIRKNPFVRVYYLYPPPSIEDSTCVLLLTVLVYLLYFFHLE